MLPFSSKYFTIWNRFEDYKKTDGGLDNNWARIASRDRIKIIIFIELVWPGILYNALENISHKFSSTKTPKFEWRLEVFWFSLLFCDWFGQ